MERIKKNDEVLVTAGVHKGKKGKVIRCIPLTERVVIEGINIRTKNQKPRIQGEKGTTIKKEMPIHVSNVQLIDPDTKKPTRVRFSLDKGKKKRVTVKSGKEI